MASSKVWVLRSLLAGGVLVLWTSSAAAPAQADAAISATLSPSTTDGAGFGVTLWGQTSSLTVNLSPATGYSIGPVSVRSNGCGLWQPAAGNGAGGYTYNAVGVGRDQDHSVGFSGQLTLNAGVAGSPGCVTSTTDLGVADLRLPFHEITQSDGSGLTVPPGMVNNPDGHFQSNLNNYNPGNIGYAVTFTVLPRWGGLSGTVGSVGFQVNGPGVAVYYQGTLVGAAAGMPSTIPVTDSGLTNAQIVILTDQTFMNSTGVTVTATFSWTSSLQAQATYVTATDYMNVLPYPPIVVCAVSFSGAGSNTMLKDSADAYDSSTTTFFSDGNSADPVGWSLQNYPGTWHSVMPPAIPQNTLAGRDPVCFTGNSQPLVTVLAYTPSSPNNAPNLRLVGNGVGSAGGSTSVMSSVANPFQNSQFALLNAYMSAALPQTVNNYAQTFQWFYDYSPPGTQPAPGPGTGYQANTTDHQLFVTLSTPQGCTISGTAEIDSPPSAKYPANGPPCPEMPALVAHPVTAKRMDWATRIGQGVTSVTNAGGTGSAETFQRQIAATPGYTLPYWQQRLLTKWDPWAFLDAQQPLAQAGDCITVSTLACAGQNMIGVAASPHQAYATADNPATPSSCQHCVRSTTTYTDNNGVQHSYFIKLNYWGNNFEGFFTVNDGGTIKAYTVYDPRGPFVNQVYYYLDVLRDATRLGTYQRKEYWVWDGNQLRYDNVWLYDGQPVGTVSPVDGTADPAWTEIPVPEVPGS